MGLREMWKDARFLAECPALLQTAIRRTSELEEENAELRRINLDLGRYSLTLLEALIVEMNDPGSLPEGTILTAACDMADQVARMEEHVT